MAFRCLACRTTPSPRLDLPHRSRAGAAALSPERAARQTRPSTLLAVQMLLQEISTKDAHERALFCFFSLLPQSGNSQPIAEEAAAGLLMLMTCLTAFGTSCRMREKEAAGARKDTGKKLYDSPAAEGRAAWIPLRPAPELSVPGPCQQPRESVSQRSKLTTDAWPLATLWQGN